jgi:poly(A) polymerase
VDSQGTAPRTRLVLMAEATDVEAAFRKAFEEGILDELIPGFKKLRGCMHGPDRHFEGDCLKHVELVLAAAAKISGLDESDRVVLLVAALVHDICKPETRQVQEDGKIIFHYHPLRASKRAAEFGESFGLTEAETARLKYVVERHVHIHSMPEFGEKKRLEYYQSPHFPVLAALQEADARASWLSANGSKHEKVHREFFNEDGPRLLAAAERKRAEGEVKRRVTKALKALGIPPGHYYGTVGNAAITVMDDEDLSTDDAAHAWVKAYVDAHPPA